MFTGYTRSYDAVNWRDISCLPAVNAAMTIVSSISDKTTPDQFTELCNQHPLFKLTMGGNCGFTALAAAADAGNSALIKRFHEIGGDTLFYIVENRDFTPLHCAVTCFSEYKGYFAALTLITLGMPVNIIHNPEPLKISLVGLIILDQVGNKKPAETPLELALEHKKFKIAMMLARIGGIAREEILGTERANRYAEVKREIDIQNKKLFLLKMMLNEKSDETFPKEIKQLIVSTSMQAISFPENKPTI